MSDHTDQDLIYIHLLRQKMGTPWPEAKAWIIEQLPEGYDPELLGKFVDERPEPGIYTNEWGVEPRFYAHRTSKRLLEFYRKDYYYE
ncbi:MAG: hypothetical protein AAF840_05565 [Bacteroidota bacterium]